MLNQQLELFEAFSAQLLSPRLNVIITTIDAHGRVNAAPFSFFAPVSYVPPRVCFSCLNHKHHPNLGFHYADTKPAEEMLKLKQYSRETDETLKDTLANVLEQGEFGVNVLPIDYLKEVVITSSRYPHGVDEMEVSGLTIYSASKIKPPLIKEAKVALECVKIAHHTLGFGLHGFTLIIGEGIACHIDSEIMEGNEIKPEKMRSLLQVAGPTYGVCNDFRYEPRHPYPDDIPVPEPVS